jgi:type II secretory pathway component GspD/PulD (secretin)
VSKKVLFLLGLFAAALTAPTFIVSAQQASPFVVEVPQNPTYADYGTSGNTAAARLRTQPSKLFNFDRASLRDVLRYLADEAGIPFVGIPEGDSANKRLVTFTMESSPFVALESLAKDNGVRISFENGVWYFRSIDEERETRLKEEEENKLIGIAYKLVYDPVERIDFRNEGSSTQGAGAGGSGTSTTSTAVSNPNLPLQNSQRVFQSKAPRIINEIRVMLGLTPITYGPDGSIQGEAPERGTTVQSTSATNDSESGEAAPQRLNPTYVPPQTPQVIYNSDNNTLWVVATRQQHKWVADYLLAVDRPQALIAIEVKFFETKKNPKKELGINWAGTMSGGFTVKAEDIIMSPGGTLSLDTQRENQRQSGALPPGESAFDYNTKDTTTNVSIAAPYSAVLSASQVAVTLQAFMEDRTISMVQYPRVLTVNNREVAITSAENTPINAGVSQVESGTTATPIGTLGYLPIGTQINILPKTVGKDQIAMTVAITISSIIGVVPINLGTGTNDYPVTSQRIYNASLQVNSGYTLAVGGLEKVDDNNNRNGIPFLQDIPGVGELFKSKARSRNKVNLIVFITPTIIENPKATRGISDPPESVVPIRPDDPVPPAFTPDGQLVGGWAAMDNALAWLEFQVRYFTQINRENRTNKESIAKLRAAIAAARTLATAIAQVRESDPSPSADLIRKEERIVKVLTELNQVLAAAQDNVL